MAMVMKMVLAMIVTMAMMILMRILCGSLAFLFQSEIFDIVGQSSLDSYLEGYNATVFAYGQTGAGKTFTMQGNLTLLSPLTSLPTHLTPTHLTPHFHPAW